MVLRIVRRKVWNRLGPSAHCFDPSSTERSIFFHCGSAKSTRSCATLCSPPWKVLFFGTDEFALESFKLLNEQYRLRHLVDRLEVVSAYKGKENAVSLFAKENGIPFHLWPPKIPLCQFDLGLVVSFGHMIPADMIESFPLGMVNVHASLLPKLRGAAPIIHALKNGDSQTGITIMKIKAERFDIGDILAQESTSIHPDETMPELHERLAKIGAKLLVETMEKMPNIFHQGMKQLDGEATYARKITSKEAIIQWDKMSAKQVYDLQRALTGLYHLVARMNEQNVKLIGICVSAEPRNSQLLENKRPGLTIFDKQKNVLLTRCRDETWISISKIIIPGRRPMSAKDFYNGFISRQKEQSIVLE